MNSKLGLDWKKVEEARNYAKNIAIDVQNFVEKYSTVSVERTICRLLGIDGVNPDEIPLPNVVVEHIKENKVLNNGVAYFIGNAMIEYKLSPQEIAEKVSAQEINLTKIKMNSYEDVVAVIKPIVEESVLKIKKNRKYREDFIENYSEGEKPYLYVIVATGNIYEDVTRQ